MTPTTVLPSHDEVLPQREPRQRRRITSEEEMVPPITTATESELDGASNDTDVGLMVSNDDLRNIPENPSFVESSSMVEQRVGESMPQYRLAAEGNFLFECESDTSESIFAFNDRLVCLKTFVAPSLTFQFGRRFGPHG